MFNYKLRYVCLVGKLLDARLGSQTKNVVHLHSSFIFKKSMMKIVKSYTESLILLLITTTKKICWSPNSHHLSSTSVVFLPDETKYCWYYSYNYGSQKTAFGEKWNDNKMGKHSFSRVRSLEQEFWMLSWLNALFCTFLLLPQFLPLCK